MFFSSGKTFTSVRGRNKRWICDADVTTLNLLPSRGVSDVLCISPPPTINKNKSGKIYKSHNDVMKSGVMSLTLNTHNFSSVDVDLQGE